MEDLKIIIDQDDDCQPFISIVGGDKITLPLAGIDSLQKFKKFLESLPDGTLNKNEALEKVNLYLNSETLH